MLRPNTPNPNNTTSPSSSSTTAQEPILHAIKTDSTHRGRSTERFLEKQSKRLKCFSGTPPPQAFRKLTLITSSNTHTMLSAKQSKQSGFSKASRTRDARLIASRKANRGKRKGRKLHRSGMETANETVFSCATLCVPLVSRFHTHKGYK